MCISGHLQESDEKKNNSKKIPTKNNKNLYNQSALNLTDIMKRLLSTIGIFLGVLILISKFFQNMANLVETRKQNNSNV